MSLSLTCRRCGVVVTADTEEELTVLGHNHAREHGHSGALSRETTLRRIRRHNSAPDEPAAGDSGRTDDT